MRLISNGEKMNRKGFVIVVVLCMIIMLGVLLFGFNREPRAELLAVDDMKRSAQSLNCARAGLNIAIAALKSTGDFPANGKLSGLLAGQIPFSLADGACSITVTEESGKLNLNLLKTKTGEPDRAKIDQLLRLIDLLNRRDLG